MLLFLTPSMVAVTSLANQQLTAMVSTDHKSGINHEGSVCVGMPKTGTKSMAKALRHLGFTVFDWEEQTFLFLDHWVDVYQNGFKPDVKRVYQNC